jgi:peptidoglycan-associated lipoprotein
MNTLARKMSVRIFALITIFVLTGCYSLDGGVRSNSEVRSLLSGKDRVYFRYGKSVVDKSQNKTLDTQLAVLREYPDVEIEVAGYCDSRGSSQFNLALGQKRANAVKKYLVKGGIASRRITAISYGKDKPIVEGKTKDAYRKNRVVITSVAN